MANISQRCPRAWLAVAACALLSVIGVREVGAAQDAGPALEVPGYAWDRTTISYSLQADRDVPSSVLAQVRGAVAEWNRRLAGLGGHYASLRLAAGTGRGADIPISVRSQTNFSPGLTGPSLTYNTSGCWFLQAPIWLDVLDEEGNVLPDDLIFSLAAHELGHALGLGHARGEDLMAPRLTGGRQTPSALDLRGVRAVFSWLDTTNNTPGVAVCPRVRGVS